MLNFQKIRPEQKAEFDQYLIQDAHRGSSYSFANLYLWGHQRAMVGAGQLILFAHFDGHTMYPYPAGAEDETEALSMILADARERGIPCRITCLCEKDMELLERQYPGKFRFHWDRDSFDYVYDINDLADLKGKKLQQKRNHVNRFWREYPEAYVRPMDETNIPECRVLAERWFARRQEQEPHIDLVSEKRALCKAFEAFRDLGMEGLVLYAEGRAVAMTMGSRLSEDTMDIHFEKAEEDIPGSYAAINREFARYLREKYPEVKYLNREDDVGRPGLRQAKLSYQPHHLVEKGWAHYAGEDFDD